MFIGELLWEGPAKGIEIMRCKGVFHDATGQTLMLQGVQDKYEFREVQRITQSSFLFVGKGPFSAEQLKSEMLSKCAI